MEATRLRRRQAVNKGSARFIPALLIGIVGYASYIVVGRLCVGFLLHEHRIAAGIAVLVVHVVLLIPMAFSYLRLLLVVRGNPGYTAQNSKTAVRLDYQGILQGRSQPPAGLEEFYTKEVFVCDGNGLPFWCTTCCNWKLDRVHHCSDAGRCVKKLDHFCPWVGGVVGEHSYKFFAQFNFYASLYTLNVLVTMAYFLPDRQYESNAFQVQWIIVLALGGLFFLFSLGMTGMSAQMIFKNRTTIENINFSQRSMFLAVLLPSGIRGGSIQPSTTDPEEPMSLAKPAGSKSVSEREIASGRTIENKASSHMSNGNATLQTVNPEIDRNKPHHSRANAQSRSRPASSCDLSVSGPKESRTSVGATSLRSSRGDVPPLPAPTDSSESVTVGAREQPNPSGQRELGRIMMHGYHGPKTVPQNGEGESISLRPLGSWQGTITYPLYLSPDRPHLPIPPMRTFAILRTPSGMNPWDLGTHQNFRQVLGQHFGEWLVPLRYSPCSSHERNDSFYTLGSSMEELKRDFGIVRSTSSRVSGSRRRKRKLSRGWENGERPDAWILEKEAKRRKREEERRAEDERSKDGL